MIISLTMNPAIDKTVEVSNFRIDHVNKIKDVHLDAAGKGINVSKVVKALGGRTKTIAFLGGENGKFIEQSLLQERLSLVPVPVDGETRINTKIVDFDQGTFTDLNEVGPCVSESQLNIFVNQVISYASSQSMVVLTGSVPPGVPETIYADLIQRLKGFGAKTVLDASGALFSEAVKMGPTIVKPNIHELEQYAGKPLTTEEDIIETCLTLLKFGVDIVVVSLGAEGALMVSRAEIMKARGLKVDVQSTVGAGDAMVAALCYGYERNFSLEEIFTLAIASSAAQITVKGTQPPDLSLIYQMRKHVEIKRL